MFFVCAQTGYSSAGEIDFLDLSLHADIDFGRFRYLSSLHVFNSSHRHVGEYTCKTLSSKRRKGSRAA